MTEGDLLVVFYSGLRPICPMKDRLIYALVGLYVVRDVVPAPNVPGNLRHENAHTRKKKIGKHDIVVRAKPGVSGRLERCIPIGEWRDRAYRVRKDLLKAWGGLTVRDGYIQNLICRAQGSSKIKAANTPCISLARSRHGEDDNREPVFRARPSP